jgi:hypothetical protein
MNENHTSLEKFLQNFSKCRLKTPINFLSLINNPTINTSFYKRCIQKHYSTAEIASSSKIKLINKIMYEKKGIISTENNFPKENQVTYRCQFKRIMALIA